VPVSSLRKFRRNSLGILSQSALWVYLSNVEGPQGRPRINVRYDVTMIHRRVSFPAPVERGSRKAPRSELGQLCTSPPVPPYWSLSLPRSLPASGPRSACRGTSSLTWACRSSRSPSPYGGLDPAQDGGFQSLIITSTLLYSTGSSTSSPITFRERAYQIAVPPCGTTMAAAMPKPLSYVFHNRAAPSCQRPIPLRS